MKGVAEFCLILCTLPLIKSTSIKFNALINLGDEWNYEYRVYRANENEVQTQGTEKPDQSHRGEHVMRKAQERAKFALRNAGNGTDDEHDTSSDTDSEEPVVNNTDKPENVQADENDTKDEDRNVFIQKIKDVEDPIINNSKKSIYFQAADKNTKQRDINSELPIVHNTDELGHVQEKKSVIKNKHNTDSSNETQETTEEVKRDTIQKDANSKDPVVNNSNKSENVQVDDNDKRQRDEDFEDTVVRNNKKPEKKKSINKKDNTNDSSSNESNSNTDSGSASKLEVSDEKSRKILKKGGKNKRQKHHAGRKGDRKKRKKKIKETAEHESDRDLDDVPNIMNYNIQRIEKLTPDFADKQKKSRDSSKKSKSGRAKKKSGRSQDPKGDLRSFFDINKTSLFNKVLDNPPMVKDFLKLTGFSDKLYNKSQQVFDAVKSKTDQEHVKDLVDTLAKSYDGKFKEFLNDTSNYKIKTDLGTQKVVLNTIDTSDMILQRLMNHLLAELDHEGVLRHNSGTAKVFKKAIKKQEQENLELACHEFNICRTKPMFSKFLTNILDVLGKCSDLKFKQTLDAFTEEVKGVITPSNMLSDNSKQKLLGGIDRLEKQPVFMTRPLVNMFKNTVMNKDKPMFAGKWPFRQGIVTSTLAILQMMDLFDKNIPGGTENVKQWAKMTEDFTAFKDGKTNNVQAIASTFVSYIKKTIMGFDAVTMGSFMNNLNKLLA